MATEDSRTRVSRGVRVALYGLVVLGVGVVAHLATSLALLARVSEPAYGRPERPPGGGGVLVVCGGGHTPDVVRDRFVQLAGGRSARLVIIPTAGEWADRPGVEHAADSWMGCGVAHTHVLHTLDRGRANDPEFVRPLTEATGVWIGGGHQWRLSDAYGGTAVEKELHALLARGGVIGGTSAGAGIMSRVMIVNGRDEAVVGRGFDLFPDVVIDQHFLRRNRFDRLLSVLETNPRLIGLGVDEQTAVEVDLKGQRLRAIGQSYAVMYVPGGEGADRRPLIEILKSGDEVDLARLRRRAPNAVISAIDIDGL